MAYFSRTIEINNKVEQVRFGSELSFRTAVSKNCFIYSDGYIDSQLICLNVVLGDEKQISFGKERLPQTSRRLFSRLCLSRGLGTSGI